MKTTPENYKKNENGDKYTLAYDLSTYYRLLHYEHQTLVFCSIICNHLFVEFSCQDAS